MPHGTKRLSVFLFFMGICLIPTLAAAQQAPPPLIVEKLSDTVYWTQGGAGGNTGIIVGTDGVIVVDAKTTASSAKEVLAKIAAITSKPVTAVILTHSDDDHVNGLAGFPTGLTIISQENCKKEMEQSQKSPTPAPSDYMQTKTIGDHESLTINGVRLQLLHWAPAHTSGDLVIYLPDQKIVFTGDIINTRNTFPRIHMEKSGTSEGWFATVQGVLKLNADTFVPGHGVLQTKVDLQKRLTDAQGRREEIKKMVGQGKSLDQIDQALGPSNPSGATYPSFTEVVFTESQGKK